MKQDFKAQISAQLIDDIANYLSTRPYREVAALIGRLNNEVQEDIKRQKVEAVETEKK